MLPTLKPSIGILSGGSSTIPFVLDIFSIPPLKSLRSGLSSNDLVEACLLTLPIARNFASLSLLAPFIHFPVLEAVLIFFSLVLLNAVLPLSSLYLWGLNNSEYLKNRVGNITPYRDVLLYMESPLYKQVLLKFLPM